MGLANLPPSAKTIKPYLVHIGEVRKPDAPCTNGLPQYYAEDPVYYSVSIQQRSFWQEHLPEDSKLTTLLEALENHDKARPFEAPVDFWVELASLMPHLKPEPPSADARIRQFRTEKGRLPFEFFDFENPAYPAACMHHCLNWCHLQNFVHPLSSTLMGGPFSVKWAVLFLAHLLFNVQHINQDSQGTRAHYTDIAQRVEITFMGTHKHRIRHSINSLTEALNQSAELLRTSLPIRLVTDLYPKAVKALQEAHAEFPKGIDGFQWFRPVSHTELESDGSRLQSTRQPDGTMRRKRVPAHQRVTPPMSQQKTCQAAKLGSNACTPMKQALLAGEVQFPPEKQAWRATFKSGSSSTVPPPAKEMANMSLTSPSTCTRGKATTPKPAKGKLVKNWVEVVLNTRRRKSPSA
ncbi:hypothetical protein RSAG8_11456, partial [Rhizoctonia solani AG-8 WAC10335]